MFPRKSSLYLNLMMVLRYSKLCLKNTAVSIQSTKKERPCGASTTCFTRSFSTEWQPTRFCELPFFDIFHAVVWCRMKNQTWFRPSNHTHSETIPKRSFIRRELQKQIRLNLQNLSNIEQNIQRHGPHHIRRLNRTHVLSADANTFSELLLRQPLPLAIVGYRAA